MTAGRRLQSSRLVVAARAAAEPLAFTAFFLVVEPPLAGCGSRFGASSFLGHDRRTSYQPGDPVQSILGVLLAAAEALRRYNQFAIGSQTISGNGYQALAYVVR